METVEMIHKWESLGLGKAPFRLVGFAAFCGSAMAEANPEAYMRANAEASRALQAFGVSGGICHVCGHDLMNNYVIRSADKKHFVVGCDCVAKTGGAGMVNAVKEMDRKRKREAKEAARLARWEAERPAREARNARCEEYEAAISRVEDEARGERVRATDWLVGVLHGMAGEFVSSICRELMEGRSFAGKSTRVYCILEDIYTRASGKRGKAREEVRLEFGRQWDEMVTSHENVDRGLQASINAIPNPYRD